MGLGLAVLATGVTALLLGSHGLLPVLPVKGWLQPLSPSLFKSTGTVVRNSRSLLLPASAPPPGRFKTAKVGLPIGTHSNYWPLEGEELGEPSGVSAADSTSDDDQSTANQMPTAVARLSLTTDATTGAAALLDGRESYDPEDDMLSFRWVVVETPNGGQAMISAPGSPLTELRVTLPGRYRLALIVSDGLQWSAPDSVELDWTAERALPVALIEGPEAAGPFQVLTLTGVGSHDPSGGGPLTFQWQLLQRPAASRVELADPSLMNLQLTPDREGLYLFSLVVISEGRQSPPTKYLVRVGQASHRLVQLLVDSDQTILLGDSVQLAARLAGVSGKSAYHIRWQMSFAPSSSHLEINQSSPTLDFKPDVVGVYLLRARLFFSDLLIQEKTVAVLVQPRLSPSPRIESRELSGSADDPPHLVVSAGRDRTHCLGQERLPLTAEVLNAKEDVQVRWQVLSAPAKSLARIESSQAAKAWLVVDRPGLYELRFIGTNPRTAASSEARVKVRVLRKDLNFALPSFEWPPAITASSERNWYGVTVHYGRNLPLTKRAYAKPPQEFEVRGLAPGTHYDLTLFDRGNQRVLASKPLTVTESTYYAWSLAERVDLRLKVIKDRQTLVELTPASRTRLEDQATNGNASSFFSDYQVLLPPLNEFDRPSYFTYGYTHKYLGVIGEEVDLPRFQYTRRLIEGHSCYEIARDQLAR